MNEDRTDLQDIDVSIQEWLNLTGVIVGLTKTKKEYIAQLTNYNTAKKAVRVDKKPKVHVMPTQAVGETALSATRNLFVSLRGGYIETNRGNFNFPYVLEERSK